MGKTICVYCSSSSAVDDVFQRAAADLGGVLGRRGHTLVYGGASVGLMGIVAASARSAGARVVGILPQAFTALASRALDEVVVTRDLRERKAEMERRSEAFIALPGGFGTLDELVEILTFRQLGIHHRPVAVVNTAGFFDPLLALFERFYELRFAKREYRGMCYAAPDPVTAVEHVEREPERPLPAKWFG